MSNLFNTLQKINRNESVKVSADVPSKPQKPRFKFEKRQGAGMVVLVAGIAILVYLLIPKNTSHQSSTQIVTPKSIPQTSSEITAPQASAPPASVNPATTQEMVVTSQPTPEEEKEFTTLVNQGVEHIEKRDYWRGLYLLNKAREIQPDRFEPLINSAVALAELGYRELAVSYLNKAREIAPNHPALEENSLILSQAGVEEANNH